MENPHQKMSFLSGKTHYQYRTSKKKFTQNEDFFIQDDLRYTSPRNTNGVGAYQTNSSSQPTANNSQNPLLTSPGTNQEIHEDNHSTFVGFGFSEKNQSAKNSNKK